MSATTRVLLRLTTTQTPRHRVNTPKHVLTVRDSLVQDLSNEVFSSGNVHLKNVEMLSSLPEGLHSFPEVCFIGKPNVGKSSLISCLLRNRRLGRSGSIPGTTRLLQFFNVGDALLLVDTPGYGGWSRRKVDHRPAERANAFSILFRYLALRKSSNLKRVYWLLEASATTPVSIQERDSDILSFLQREEIPFSILLTKIDRHWRRSREIGMLGNHEYCPKEGIQRNIREIHDFFGTDHIPILGVSANRMQPNRCMHIDLLQHDIVHYCTKDLHNEELTLKGLKNLSYAPPHAEIMDSVQHRYPIESFVVPDDNNQSLQSLVRRHEELKGRYLGPCTQFSGKELSELFMERKSGLTVDAEAEPDIPRSHALLGSPSTSPPEAERWTSWEETREELPTQHLSEECISLDRTTSSPPNSLDVVEQQPFDESATHEQTASVSLPFSLDKDAYAVRAINGVAIPRSMIPPSVENLAERKEDELSSFAAKSGVGAYEELLMTENTAGVFTEYSKSALLSEDDLASVQRAQTKSARRRRNEQLLKKYIDKERKERSIYMHAEGYMCPWLAGAGQTRRAVMGMSSDLTQQSSTGVLKGLKSKGFGGKSYSSRTLKNRGRATKKTGSWAA